MKTISVKDCNGLLHGFQDTQWSKCQFYFEESYIRVTVNDGTKTETLAVFWNPQYVKVTG